MNETIKREKNIKLYPIYKMFSWDLLFYYAIIFLFLTQVKGLTASDILLADAFYPLSKLGLQLPCIMLVDWLGKRKSILIANSVIAASLLFLILGNGLITLIIFNIITALGFNLKDMCESSILYNSIADSDGKLDTFSKFDGRGSSFHYYLDSISSVSTGFLFVINPYLPVICCFIFMCVSIYLATKFYSLNEENQGNSKQTYNFVSYIGELKSIFKFIVNSNRLKGLLFFSATFMALLSILSTLKTSILVEINVPEIYFGIIIAGAQLLSGIASKRHLFFNKLFKNKTLSILSIGASVFLMIAGFTVFFNLPFLIILIVISLWFAFYSFIKGTYYPIIKRYLNSFSIPRVNTKIYATQTIFDSLARVPASLFASYILSIANTSTSFIIIGLTFTIAFIFLLNYMNTRVGLKPEEYPDQDIYYLDPSIR